MRLFTLIALTSLSAQAKPLDLKVQERTLSNGLQVVSVERSADRERPAVGPYRLAS